MHPLRRTLITLLALCLILPLAAPATANHPARQSEPVTLYTALAQEPRTIDPAGVANDYEFEITDQLFLGLTAFDPLTTQIVPALAHSWSVSDDGLVWTFVLRNDVPWVHWDSAAQRVDVIRMVTAHDAAYSMKRTCDPNWRGYYSAFFYPVIRGCNQLALTPAEEVTDAGYDLVEVYARDDTTLEVHLQQPVGYFLSLTAMWNLRPVPQEVIAEYGYDWTLDGHIVTNGPFVLAERTRDARYVLQRNSYLPDDLTGPGNVERVVIVRTDGLDAAGELFAAHQLDYSNIVSSPIIDALTDADKLIEKVSLIVIYFRIVYRPPFDNVHVRRAFSAALDRSQLTVRASGTAVPMTHFTPPGMFGAPPIDEVGVGYDPDYARAQLALAGYPDCEGFPPVTFQVSDGAERDLALLVNSAETVLGCDPALIAAEVTDFAMMQQNANGPPETRPHIWFLGWAPDFPDAHNWVGHVLSCRSYERPCTEIDDLIDQAALASDPLTRVALYRDIEERFFGPEGEVPIIPLFMLNHYLLAKTWVSGPFETDGLFGGVHFDWYTIDQEAQLAARGGGS